MSEKLQKVLARAGLGSRRALEQKILEGRISVNGQTATLGDRVTTSDVIKVDGSLISLNPEAGNTRRILIYNKPEGEVCTRSDPEKRKTVFQSLPPLHKSRWISIGRLDFTTSGLMMFTNNGELANKLTKSSKDIEREYLVRVHGKAAPTNIECMLRGVRLENGTGRFKKIILHESEGRNQWYFFVVTERNNRFIKSLWESQGLLVSRLKQIRIGPIALAKQVRQGCWTELKNQSLQAVLDLAK